MKLGLTKSQLGYYFWPKDLKHFEPDIFINYGNGCVLKFYTLQSIKAVKEEKKYHYETLPKEKIHRHAIPKHSVILTLQEEELRRYARNGNNKAPKGAYFIVASNYLT
jgi:hypothetical protein